ncbi:MAG: alpha/beta hydrolase [Acidimicrobiia bacterium]
MAKTQVVTILFCDLVASTERRARLGDDRFDEFSQRFMRTLRDAIADHNGREVSSAGDGLMVVFPESVADAVACSTQMHDRVAALDPEDPARLRIGISTGEVAEDGDNYSGMPIVEAARLEAAATPGQTLANAVVRTLVGTRRALRFRDVGALTLKGIPHPLPAVEVVVSDAMVEASDAPPPASVTPVHRGRSSRRRPLIAGAAVVLVAAVVVAVLITTGGNDATQSAAGVPNPVGYTPKYLPSSTCPDAVRQVAADATCGKLVVPENRAEPHGKQITLQVSQAPARTPSPAAPSIDVCGCENLGNSLTRDHAALIHVASRGYEGSDPTLTCPEFAATREPAYAVRSDDLAEIAKGTDAFRQCYAHLVAHGIHPSQYNSLTAAQDVLDLMSALKIPRADFTAFGETDAEVFEIMRRAPAAVRSITLEDPPPPGDTHLSSPVTDLAGAFDRFTKQCQRNATCNRVAPDLATAWLTDYDTLDRAPEPLTVANPLGDDRPPVSLLLDGPRAADALATALADASTYSVVPAAITDIESSAVVGTAAIEGGDGLSPDAPWGAQASYFCSYLVHTQSPDVADFTARQFRPFVRSNDRNWGAWCKAWPVPDISARLSNAVVSSVPALLFRGGIAPLGNPGWMPAVARGLAHAQQVVFPTLGLDLLATGPPCLSDLRHQFLENPLRHLPIAACVKQSPPIDFVGP